MAILTLKVKGQTLTVESEIDRIVENSVNYLDFEIIRDDENWEDLATKVIVTYDKKAWEAFTIIPSETIHSPGFTISIIGYRKPGTNGDNDLGEIVTTYPVAVKVFPSGATNGSDPEDTAIELSTAEELNAKIDNVKYQANEKIDDLTEKITTLSDENKEINEEITKINEEIVSLSENVSNKIQETEQNLINTIYSMDLLNIQYRERIKGAILTSRIWGMVTDNYQFVLIPVKGGNIVDITSNGYINGTMACLKSFSGVVDGESPDFSEVEGWTGRVDFAGNTKRVLPDDAKYLYILVVYSGQDCTPIKCNIGGYDYLTTAHENIQNIYTMIGGIENGSY